MIEKHCQQHHNKVTLPHGCDCKELNPIAGMGGIRGLGPWESVKKTLARAAGLAYHVRIYGKYLP